jgi:hypothetical protein
MPKAAQDLVHQDLYPQPARTQAVDNFSGFSSSCQNHPQ